MDPIVQRHVLTVRWFNKDGSWRGQLKEDDTQRLNLATRWVNMLGKPPTHLKDGEVWLCKIPISRYFFNEHLQGAQTRSGETKGYHRCLEAQPLRRHHSNGQTITKEVICEAKQAIVSDLGQSTPLKVGNYDVYSELQSGPKSLHRFWRVFDGDNLIGTWQELITSALIGTPGCPTPFEITNLERAMNDLGRPEFFFTTEGKPIAIWKDRRGNTLVASISVQALFESATQRELKEIHVEGETVYGEFYLVGTVASTITVRLASGERVQDDCITPASFSEFARSCSPEEQKRLVETMRAHDLMATPETYQEEQFREALLKFGQCISDANDIAREGLREQCLILIEQAQLQIMQGNQALSEKLSQQMTYLRQPESLFYMYNAGEENDSAELHSLVEKLCRYKQTSLQRIARSIERLAPPQTLRSPFLAIAAE